MLAAVEAAEAREALRAGSRAPRAASQGPSDESHRHEVLELRAQLTAQQGKITELLQVPHFGLSHMPQPCPRVRGTLRSVRHIMPRHTAPALCRALGLGAEWELTLTLTQP